MVNSNHWKRILRNHGANAKLVYDEIKEHDSELPAGEPRLLETISLDEVMRRIAEYDLIDEKPSDIEPMMEEYRVNKIDRWLAVMSATHNRLGSESLLGQLLTEDLLFKVLTM
jgi:hypothetical protein